MSHPPRPSPWFVACPLPGARWWPILAAFLWGTSYPVLEFALLDFTALQIAFLRAVLGTVTMGLVVLAEPGRTCPRTLKGWLRLTILALFAAGFYWPLQNLAVELSQPVNAAFLGSTFPVMVVLIGPLVVGARTSRRALAGSVVGLLGAYLIISRGQLLDLFLGRQALGDLLALLSSVFYAAYLLLIQSWDDEIPLSAITVTFYTFALSLLPLGLLAWGDPIPLRPGLTSIGGVLWLGVMSSTVAYLAMNVGVGAGGALHSAILQMLTPLVAALFSWVFFASALTGPQWLGAILVLAGIFLSSSDGG